MTYTSHGGKEFIKILLSKLDERKSKNRRVSLRSFAKELKISVSTLSEVLNGHKNFSPTTAEMIADILELPPLEKEIFRISVAAAKPGSQRKAAELRLQKLLKKRKSYPIDHHEISKINHWRYFAIVELVALGADTTAQIATRLGLDTGVVQNYLETLIQIGWITPNQGRYKCQFDSSSTSDDISSIAIQQYHKSALDQAKDALDKLTLDSREFQSIVLTCDPDRMAEAKAKIRKFVDEFCEEFGSNSSNPNDEVYHLGLQYFKLTKK